MALEIDQEARPPDALVLAKALRNGARGISPYDGDAPTAHLGTKAATTVLPAGAADQAPTAATRVAPRPAPARTVPARTAQPAMARPPTARAQAAERGRSRGAGRALRRVLAVVFLCFVFIAAVVIAVAVSTSTSSTVVHFRTIVAHDVHDAVNAVKNFINQYTK
jgi:hypothetical protein